MFRFSALEIIVFILMVFVTASALCAQVPDSSSGKDLSKLIIEIDWLKENLKREGVVVVDTRKEEQFLKGHIDGAVNIPVETTFGKPPENDLIAPISHIQSILGNAGIGNGTNVILYDDGKYVDAARVFWVLEVYGHQNAAILNGGYSGWHEKGLPVSTKKTTLSKQTFLPTIVPNILSTKFSTRLAINDTSKIIIDARSSQEYMGEESRTSRFGHIPTAINIPFYQNFDKQGGIKTLKPIESLEKVYENIDKNKKVITYCNRGKESALTYFILRRLGYNVSAYDGSWLEWSSDNSLPINIPDKKID